MNYTMSKLKLLTIAVIGLLIINLCVVAFLLLRKPPHRPDGKPPMTQTGPKKIIIERLHFDREQSAQYEGLIEKHQAVIKSLNDSIKIAKNDLYSSLTNENFTGKDSLIVSLGLLQRKVEMTHYDHFASIRNLCKPEQIEDFKKLTKELARFFAPGRKDGPSPPKD